MLRRQAVVLGISAPWLVGSAAAAKRIDVSRLSAISDEIAPDQAGAISFARQYGMRWLELRSKRETRKEYFQLPADELKADAKAFRDGGVGISFLNTSMLKFAIPGVETVNPRHMASAARYEKRQQELESAMRAAHILGVSKVRIFTFFRAKDQTGMTQRIADDIGPLAARARKEGIELLIENENACNVASCAELVTLLKAIPDKNVGINWDPFNAENTNEKAFPDGYQLLPRKRIGNVQVKGKSLLAAYTPMDWPGIFRTLVQDGYKGEVGLETHIFGETQIKMSHECMKELVRMVAS
ncbi:MAG: sugar phosphate isomerase/epimerase [Bryobacterales bacterium]|nr:sugar phosphate isomerase/epimerase [Bryobacterales bacterium]